MGAEQSKENAASNAAKKATDPADNFVAPDNDYQLVFEAIKTLEHTLMVDFDATGDSLHDMIASTNEKLPMDLIVDMRALATIRNNMAHEYSCDNLSDRNAFVQKYLKCTRRLNEQVNRRKEDDEKFYKEIVERHRQLHPRPNFVVEEEETMDTSPVHAAPMGCGVACF